MILLLSLVLFGGLIPAVLALKYGLMAALLAFLLAGNIFAVVSLLALFPPESPFLQKRRSWSRQMPKLAPVKQQHKGWKS